MLTNEARDTLRKLEVATYPKLKQDGRKEVHKRYYKCAFPQTSKPKNVVKLSDLTRILNG